MNNRLTRRQLLAASVCASSLTSVATCKPAVIGGAALLATYEKLYAGRLLPLLLEVIRFPTVEGNAAAFAAQKAWLRNTASQLGLAFRDAGLVTELELPGPAGAPVLGLMVHGDVVPPGDGWTFPPFAGEERGGFVFGRGAADDKGPLVQALLAMAALRDTDLRRTHTVRLLVGSDEEGGATDVTEYLKTHAPPDYTLVLDSGFPVIVGEKAWDALTVAAADPYRVRGGGTASWAVTNLEAGTSASIVPARASAVLQWLPASTAEMPAAIARITGAKPPAGYRVASLHAERRLTIDVHGRAAHSGMNIAAGRNALVLLAKLLDGRIAPAGASDLLAFAAEAGSDLHGASFGLTQSDPLWGRYAVNVATLEAKPEGLKLTVNLRRPPPVTAPQMKARLFQHVARFNARRGAALVAGGYFEEEPLVIDARSPLVTRLLAVYSRATGAPATPAVAGGGTYARRLPNSVAFGMWFPGSPYPGHDMDERIPVRDLHRGVGVLLEALADIACGPRIDAPLGPVAK